jgi:cytoskeletal protein CcmA (bactofilin family)
MHKANVVTLEQPVEETQPDTKRRFLERVSGSPTFIGKGTCITGNLKGAGQFVVFGEVEGDGDIDGGLNLASVGVWRGKVRARQAIVAGTVIGGLEIADKLEIGYSAVIRGKVSARSVAIAKGAVIDGEVVVTSGAPVVEFEEKRQS